MDSVIAVSTHYKRFSFLLVHNRSPFCINIKVAHTLYLIHLNRWHICAAHFADIRLISEKQFFGLVHLLIFGYDVCITPKGVLHPAESLIVEDCIFCTLLCFVRHFKLFVLVYLSFAFVIVIRYFAATVLYRLYSMT